MGSGPEYLEFVYLPSYRRSAASLINADAERAIEQVLCDDPQAGAVIAGTGGVRKLRVALEGRGKSGGARVIYYYREAKGRIYLILLYAKGRKDNLTQAERNMMRKLTTMLEGER